MSCVTYRIARCSRSRRSASRLSTPSRIETSSIDTGSSASSTRGRTASARAIATRQLMRKLRGVLRCRLECDTAQQLGDRLVEITTGGVVDLQRTGKMVAALVHRIQRCERVLEDHLHL